MPLADEMAHVSSGLQLARDGRLVGGEAPVIARVKYWTLEPQAHWQPSRHEGTASGSTDWLGVVAVDLVGAHVQRSDEWLGEEWLGEERGKSYSP